MTHRLATNYAKNYCNRTPIVKVIVENVVTCFFGTRCRIFLDYAIKLHLGLHALLSGLHGIGLSARLEYKYAVWVTHTKQNSEQTCKTLILKMSTSIS